jgi:AcrR family transcriptional regulator
MISRSESAAATRRSLLDAARALLNEGGPQNVTLREVGTRANASRGAAYRHFADKESLLAAVGAECWDHIANELSHLVSTGPDDDGVALLQEALMALITVGRNEPEVYRMMFTMPERSPELIVHAAGRAQSEFLRIVGSMVGDEHAHLYGAMLLTSAHGVISMDVSGHLSPQMWHTTPDNLLAALLDLIAHRAVK